MTQELEKTLSDFGDWSDGGDIFYRRQDKVQFQRCLKAVVNDQLGLAVVASSEKMLHHYCRLILSRLREIQELKLEILLPSNLDTLLKRFNQIMATMPIDRALRPPHPNTPITLMVVNDAHLVEQQQWSLLAQLLSDFPGVNVRLVLFVNSTEWPRYDTALKLFGRKLHQWRLEVPTTIEAKDLLMAAQKNGSSTEVEALLSELEIDISEDIFDRQESLDEVEMGETPPSSSQSIDPKIDAKPLYHDDSDADTLLFISLVKGIEPIFLKFACYLLFIFGISWVLQPKQSTLDAPTIISSQAMASKQEPIVLSSEAIIQTAGAMDYFVHHSFFRNKEMAISYVNDHPTLKNVMLVSIKGSESTVHGLMSGPFNSEQDARDFMQLFETSKDGWVISATQLQMLVR
tara:strand:+ start:3514 stop:4722 length:1209 start_codon:yes stop_codon:yes gene_type:complete